MKKEASVYKRVFAYFLLNRLELLVVRCQVDQHGALTGAVERQIWVCTYRHKKMTTHSTVQTFPLLIEYLFDF